MGEAQRHPVGGGLPPGRAGEAARRVTFKRRQEGGEAEETLFMKFPSPREPGNEEIPHGAVLEPRQEVGRVGLGEVWAGPPRPSRKGVVLRAGGDPKGVSQGTAWSDLSFRQAPGLGVEDRREGETGSRWKGL